MSGPAVLIGYILLVPSILGVLGGGCTAAVSATGGATLLSEGQSEFDKLDGQTERSLMAKYLEDQGVDAQLAETIVASQQLTPDQEAMLDFMQLSRAREVVQWVGTPQREALQHYERMQAAGKAGAVIGTGMGVIIGGAVAVASLVSGLLGYLLVMKKKVLQCVACGATVAAS